MKKILILCFISVTFFSFGKTVQAATSLDNDLVVVNTDGTIVSGTQFSTAGKRIIRPQFQGLSSDLLDHFVTSSGERVFSKTNASVLYKENDVFFYTNISQIDGRNVSIKITMLSGPMDGHVGAWYYNLLLTDAGVLHIGNYSDNAKDIILFNMQAVYTDTKTPVENSYLSFPFKQRTMIYNSSEGTTSSADRGYAGTEKNSLVKEYYLKNAVSGKNRPITGNPIKSEKVLKDGQRSYNFSPPALPIADQDFVSIATYFSVVDNKFGFSPAMQGYKGSANTITFFESSVLNPFTPEYPSANISGDNNKESKGLKFKIDQSLYNTYPSLYPSTFELVVTDPHKIFKDFTAENFSIRDKNGVNIKPKVTMINISSSKVSIKLSTDYLKSLQDNNLHIEYESGEYDLDRLTDVYNADLNEYAVPLETALTWSPAKQGVEEPLIRRVTSSGTLIQGGGPFATPNPSTVYLGAKSSEIDPYSLVKNLSSILDNDHVLVSLEDNTIEFNEIGETEISVILQSEKSPSHRNKKNVKISVTGDLLSKEYFDNQSWLVSEIERQLSLELNKEMMFASNIYYKDLKVMKKIDLPKGTGMQYPNSYIPRNIMALTNLESFVAVNQSLTKQIPDTINRLTKLGSLNLSQNKLVGQIPDLNEKTQSIDMRDNQITYNGSSLPSTLTSGIFSSTFVSEESNAELKLKLAANFDGDVTSATQIKPFDSKDAGFFGLHALLGSETKELYEEHIYTILDENNNLLYEGKQDSNLILEYHEEEKYTVILDNADKNPNNQVIVKTFKGELKFEQIPEIVHLSSDISNLTKQNLSLSNQLAIFDSRPEGNWNLKIIISPLESLNKRILEGNFSYTDGSGMVKVLNYDTETEIETGKGNRNSPVNIISSDWTDNKGLRYQNSNNSNYMGDYLGNIAWILEDVPG